jgi:hypothetical protein
LISAPATRRHLAILAPIVLGGFCLRVLQLGFTNFNSDESWFLRLAYFGSYIQALTFKDPHPPLFYALLQVWLVPAGLTQFAIRFLPVLGGTLLIPVLYKLGAILGSRRIGLAAAFAGAASPGFIFYSRDVGDSGLMAFLGALSFALLFLAYRRPALLPAYIAAALADLYAHYYAIPIVGLQLLILALLLFRSGRLRPWPWLAAPAALALGFLPWLVLARSTITTYNVGHGTLAQVADILNQTFRALNFGFAVRAQDVTWPALIVAGLLAAGIAAAYRRNKRLLALAAVYAGFPVVFGAATLLHQTNFNPRYLLSGAPGYLLLLGSGLAFLWRWQPAAGVLSGAFLLALTGLSVRNADFSDDFAPNGYRELTSYLATHAGNDSIVLDGVSQSELFWYYGETTAKLRQHAEFLPRDTLPETEQAIHDLLAAGGVWYVESDVLRYDPRKDVERLLAANGYQARDLHFRGQRLEYFGGSPAGPVEARQASLGALQLVGATRPAKPIAAGQALGVELDWQHGAASVRPFKLSLRLEDPSGAVAAQNDTLPQGGYAEFDAWQAGQVLPERAGLVVPPGAIPGQYKLTAVVYDAASGQSLGPPIDLGQVAVDHSAPENAGAADLPATGVQLGSLRLEAASVPANGITPGDRVPLTLLWSGSRTSQPATFDVSLGSSRQSLVAGGERYPSTDWQSPDLVRDVVNLRVPPALAAGAYPVAVGGIAIGTLHVLPVERSFTAPPLAHTVDADFGDAARLLGYDLTPTSTGLHLTLTWQALSETPVSYTVFVHALGEGGAITAQADVPAGTDRWVKSQVATTAYDLAAPVTDRLEIGLYDASTGQRLPVCCPAADSLILSG